MIPPKETSNGAALELVETAYLSSTDEPDLSDQMEGWSLEYKCDVRSWLDTLTTKVRQVKAQLDEDIANELGENNAIRIADRIYRAQQGGTWKVTEDAANDGTLAAWLGDDWVHIVNLRAQGAVAKTNLTKLAEERLSRMGTAASAYPEAASEAVEETVKQFMTRERSGGPLTVMPVDRAPKFLQKLEDGQTLYKPGQKELGE